MRARLSTMLNSTHARCINAPKPPSPLYRPPTRHPNMRNVQKKTNGIVQRLLITISSPSSTSNPFQEVIIYTPESSSTTSSAVAYASQAVQVEFKVS